MKARKSLVQAIAFEIRAARAEGIKDPQVQIDPCSTAPSFPGEMEQARREASILVEEELA